jgi:hypothetical protein
MGLSSMFARERAVIEQATQTASDGINVALVVASVAVLLAGAALAVALLSK